MKVLNKKNFKRSSNLTAEPILLVRLLRGQRRRRFMTANQVAFQQQQEAKRHNLMEESLKNRIQEGQMQRWQQQNVVDVSNAKSQRIQAQAARTKAVADAITAPFRAIGSIF